ncbi:TIGR02391 family protein [Pedobacter sp. WC2423]|uniref:TIGR02391 family protein n=1 Tax=Pedobacter sp. WC2423 TaxID=3234142 RepID=UPI00346664B8
MANIEKQPIITEIYLESICAVIGDTVEGLTGTEITKILADCKMTDNLSMASKSTRLYNAFVLYQNRNQCSNGILKFLSHAMHPARYMKRNELFQYRLNELNKSLSFIGLELSKEAKYKKVAAARTLSDAQERASHYKSKLELRNIHPEVFKYCDEELVKENYFHSVFEGVKGVAQRLRDKTGVHADGNALVDVIFSTANPLLKINPLLTDTQRSEHLGLSNMIKGLFGVIRNPTAHTPKIKFVINEAEALDIMTIVSYVHKKLDKGV